MEVNMKYRPSRKCIFFHLATVGLQ